MNRKILRSRISSFTLFVAGHQERRSVPGDHNVCQQDVQELCHVSHFFLEDSAVHHKHNRSEETEEMDSEMADVITEY